MSHLVRDVHWNTPFFSSYCINGKLSCTGKPQDPAGMRLATVYFHLQRHYFPHVAELSFHNFLFLSFFPLENCKPPKKYVSCSQNSENKYGASCSPTCQMLATGIECVSSTSLWSYLGDGNTLWEEGWSSGCLELGKTHIQFLALSKGFLCSLGQVPLCQIFKDI